MKTKIKEHETYIPRELKLEYTKAIIIAAGIILEVYFDKRHSSKPQVLKLLNCINTYKSSAHRAIEHRHISADR